MSPKSDAGNRLAAHNSRERKRQEVEALQIRNSELEQRMKEMENQLAAYRQLLPGADVPAIITEHPAPLPTLTYLDEISTDAKPEIPPSQASFESPASLLTTLDSPVDTAPSKLAGLSHTVQLQGHPDDSNVETFFDFDLFPTSNPFPGSDSFFDESFEGPAITSSHPANPNDTLDPFDGSIFDLQPGAGATLAVCDAPGIAAESANH